MTEGKRPIDAPYRILNASPSIPLIANIPHNSPFVPSWAEPQFCIDTIQLREQVRLLTDWHTEELYSDVVTLGGTAAVFDINRFVVDPERFADDASEVMAARGMGVIYERGTHEAQIRHPIDYATRSQLLDEYYWPYHQALEGLAASALDRFGQCVVLDCHSYPELVLPYELSSSAARPEICIGTDSNHTPPALIESLRAIAERHGKSFGCDVPFAGTYVPLKYYKDPRVVALMLEIRRDQYLDESSSKLNASFEATKAIVREMIQVAAAFRHVNS